MSNDQFKNIRDLGLTIIDHTKGSGLPSFAKQVSADDLEKLLAEAPVVYGLIERPDGWTCFSRSDGPHLGDTHTARLIGVKEIVRESEERQLLREILFDKYQSTLIGPKEWGEFQERARRLLGEK